MLQLHAKLLKALTSEASPAQISLALVAGMIVGLTPLWNLHNLLILFLVFLFRVNLSAFFLSWILFSGIAYALDPLMGALGEALLTADSLRPLWTAMYNSTFWQVTHFNNTLLMGSLLLSLALAIPLYFASRYLVIKYRAHLLAWVRKSRLAEVVYASRFYRLYQALPFGGS